MALAGASLVILTPVFVGTVRWHRGGGGASPMASPLAPMEERFVTLRAAHSNRCSLQGSELADMPHDAMLQGSCCSAMDRQAYLDQRRKLTAYRSEPLIPQDPYDIPVALAQRLVSYQSIPLTPAQQAAYQDAVSRSHEHGPCCCHCWRWDAFEGQAKFLVANRSYTGAQVAVLWDLEDGCGGPKSDTG